MSATVPAASSFRCPASGTKGEPVRLLTIKALLAPAALRRLEDREYLYCSAPSCDFVYFDREGRSVFHKSDLSIRVGAKEISSRRTVCYCFGYTLEDLEQKPGVAAAIEEHVRAGRCACEVRNPRGICCLGEIGRALRRVPLRDPAAV